MATILKEVLGDKLCLPHEMEQGLLVDESANQLRVDVAARKGVAPAAAALSGRLARDLRQPAVVRVRQSTLRHRLVLAGRRFRGACGPCDRI